MTATALPTLPKAQTGIKGLDDVIIAPGFMVGHYVRHDQYNLRFLEKKKRYSGDATEKPNRKRLALLAFFGLRTNELGDFGHFPADFFFDDFGQSNVGNAHAGRNIHEGTAEATTTGVELADTARYQVDEDVWVADFFGGFFSEFSVH